MAMGAMARTQYFSRRMVSRTVAACALDRNVGLRGVLHNVRTLFFELSVYARFSHTSLTIMRLTYKAVVAKLSNL